MNYEYEQLVAQGQKPSVKKDDITYLDPEGPTLSTDELGEVRSAITAVAGTVPGKRLVTASGHHGEGKGTQPQHLMIVVSRDLSD